MTFLEHDSSYCPVRVLRDTVQMGNWVIIKPDNIPDEGCCLMSSTGKERCQYLYPEYCPRFQKQDMCEFPWAAGNSQFPDDISEG